ncbi:hypothetical protein [Burkholderia cenocepacia]|uniref:hypothetical protein n=1 Tax=Burkholderia cenocepacia TaxID=95486 RepID=UPI00076189D6|nr:hypothetical protein [Burkholderia cenocepacia]KWU24769.1 hypothetical protein AS149_31995 [Burkholderia cenocepacia]
MKLANEVLLPPLCPTGIVLNFFQDLRVEDAAPKLLATMAAWLRISRLTSQECSTLIASGIVTEDAWYALAYRWMLEAREALKSQAAREQAIDEVLEELEPLMRRSFELVFFLKTHFPEATREQRPQTACIH